MTVVDVNDRCKKCDEPKALCVYYRHKNRNINDSLYNLMVENNYNIGNRNFTHIYETPQDRIVFREFLLSAGTREQMIERNMSENEVAEMKEIAYHIEYFFG